MTEDVPILRAYSVPTSLSRKRRFANLAASWLAPCDFCGRVHLHGKLEGYRQSHCRVGLGAPKYEKDPPPMYKLKFAGEAPPEIVNQLTNKRRRAR